MHSFMVCIYCSSIGVYVEIVEHDSTTKCMGEVLFSVPQTLVSKVWDVFVMCTVQVHDTAYQVMRNCMEVD